MSVKLDITWPIGLCGCGKPMYAWRNEIGAQTAVGHTGNDDFFHMEYFAGLRVLTRDKDETEKLDGKAGGRAGKE